MCVWVSECACPEYHSLLKLRGTCPLFYTQMGAAGHGCLKQTPAWSRRLFLNILYTTGFQTSQFKKRGPASVVLVAALMSVWARHWTSAGLCRESVRAWIEQTGTWRHWSCSERPQCACSWHEALFFQSCSINYNSKVYSPAHPWYAVLFIRIASKKICSPWHPRNAWKVHVQCEGLA